MAAPSDVREHTSKLKFRDAETRANTRLPMTECGKVFGMARRGHREGVVAHRDTFRCSDFETGFGRSGHQATNDALRIPRDWTRSGHARFGIVAAQLPLMPVSAVVDS